MAKRKPEISALNVLFCLLVVFIHVSSEQITGLNKSAPVYFLIYLPWRLSAFVMQGFVLLSGVKFFIKYGEGEFKYLAFLKNRFLKIYIPYVLWVIVYYLYFCHLNYYDLNWPELLNFLLIGNIVSPFYFIIVIMQFYLFMPLWIFLIKKTDAVLLIPASVFIMLIMKGVDINYSDRIFTTYLAYWVIGCYIGANYGNFKEIIKRNRAFLTAVFVSALVFDAVISCISAVGGKSFPFLEALHVFYCISAILFLFGLGFRLKNLTELKTIKKLDGLSFGIFLSHCFFIYMASEIMAKIGINRHLGRFAFKAAFVYFFSVALCGVYSLIKNKLAKR